MTDEQREKKVAALAELDKLTAKYRRAERAFNAARDDLHASIVRHLTERNARPGEVAEHSPYDRNHVGRIAKAAGVPPLREPKPRGARAGRNDSPETAA